MLDRLSPPAQRAVTHAEEEARGLGHGHVGTEHLLLGLLAEPGSAAAQALEAAGASLDAARPKVAEVVGRTGSDSAGPLPFTPRAERALERASRFSLQRQAARVEPEHVLLGVLDVEGNAGQVLRGIGVDVVALRGAVDGTTSGRASAPEAPAEELTPAEPPAEPPAETPPRCPTCAAPLDASLAHRVVPARDPAGGFRDFAVAYCSACGAALGATPAPSRRRTPTS